ncbi:hypothetical protein A3F66_00945 [candidate division TM6 bacterium RIFCSPHIGHO2_12_FULL_32_22]|nr:MAG: hypothetical protein A3F66_00945 [candidate division TM6 bacterium RIFCSPHIGHO2_12_FULL_32_22]
MTRKKILKKREKLLVDIPITSISAPKIKKLKTIEPRKFFQDSTKVGEALLQCLVDNDTDSFIDILDEYLRINRSKLAKKSGIGRSTIQEILSKKGNPTLKTIAKIVHFSTISDSLKK